MKFKFVIILFSILLFSSGCQTIKKKSDEVTEKENKIYGQLVGKKMNDIKIKLGNPAEDYIDESGNKIFVYQSKKYGIACERKFVINKDNIVESFSSSGCI